MIDFVRLSTAIAALAVLVRIGAPAAAQCASPDVVLKELDAGTSGVALRTPDGAPVVGGSFSLRFEGGPPLETGVIFYSPFSVPVFDPVFQATIHTGTPLFFKLFGTNLFGASKKLFKAGTVGPDLCGVEVVFQAGVVDLGAPGGLAITNAVRIRVGSPNAPLVFQPQSTPMPDADAIAFGDLDGDGLREMATTAPLDDELRVHGGLAIGGFAASVGFATGDAPSSVDLVDLSGDSELDAVVANELSNDVSVLIGDGAGGFAPAVTYAAGNKPVETAIADFDGDGLLDVATANAGSGGGRVLLGSGGGALDAPAFFAVGTGMTDIVTADVDEDGEADLVTSYTSGNAVAVLRGNGDGTFAPAVSGFMGATPRAVVVADFDGDTFLDFATANRIGETVTVRFGDGLGGLGFFLPDVSIPMKSGPVDLVAHDLDGDAATDMLSVNEVSGSVGVLLNDGAATFDAVQYVVAETVATAAITDVDLDGADDLVVAVNGGGTGDWVLLPGNGDGSLRAIARTPLDVPPLYEPNTQFEETKPLVVDLDGDGRGDFVSVRTEYIQATTELLGTVTVVLTRVDGTPGEGAHYPVGPAPTQPVAIDLDFDGDRDLVTVRGQPWIVGQPPSDDDVSILINDGTGAFSPFDGYSVTGHRPLHMFVTDFDGDALPDVVLNGSSGSTTAVLIGQGDGTLAPAAEYASGGSFGTLADLNLDGFPDAVNTDFSNGELETRFNDQLGGIAAAPIETPIAGASALRPVAGDFDEDGVPDVVLTLFVSQSTTPAFGATDGTFTAGPFTTPGVHNWFRLADLDGDGHQDWIGRKYTLDMLLVNLGDGSGGFSSPIVAATDLDHDPSLADFDGDGILDLALDFVSGENVLWIHRGDGDGTFTPLVSAFLGTPAGVYGRNYGAGDIDLDGIDDLAIDTDFTLFYALNQLGE